MLGGLVEKAGLLETFSLPLGDDFQKNPDLKNEISALFNGLLVLNEMVNSGEIFQKDLWAQQGLQKFREMKREKELGIFCNGGVSIAMSLFFLINSKFF